MFSGIIIKTTTYLELNNDNYMYIGLTIILIIWYNNNNNDDNNSLSCRFLLI